MRRLLVLSILLLSGCATAYQKTGWMGGYSDKRIQDDTFQVKFKGNSYTGSRKAEDFAMLRCAEVALQNGFKYFVVVENAGEDKGLIRTEPASGGSYVSSKKLLSVQRPLVEKTIQCFNEKPAVAPTAAYDAAQIRADIRARYNLTQ